MKSVNAWCQMIRDYPSDRSHVNDRGNLVWHSWRRSERYIIDFAEDFFKEGWEQFDTDQDAWYFGVWVNRKTLCTLSYTEGDWYFVECEDVAHYNAEIMDACKFFGEGMIALCIHANGDATKFVQDRSEFLVKEGA